LIGNLWAFCDGLALPKQRFDKWQKIMAQMNRLMFSMRSGDKMTPSTISARALTK
jgi:hypothetical protein